MIFGKSLRRLVGELGSALSALFFHVCVVSASVRFVLYCTVCFDKQVKELFGSSHLELSVYFCMICILACFLIFLLGLVAFFPPLYLSFHFEV